MDGYLSIFIMNMLEKKNPHDMLIITKFRKYVWWLEKIRGKKPCLFVFDYNAHTNGRNKDNRVMRKGCSQRRRLWATRWKWKREKFPTDLLATNDIFSQIRGEGGLRFAPFRLATSLVHTIYASITTMLHLYVHILPCWQLYFG